METYIRGNFYEVGTELIVEGRAIKVTENGKCESCVFYKKGNWCITAQCNRIYKNPRKDKKCVTFELI